MKPPHEIPTRAALRAALLEAVGKAPDEVDFWIKRAPAGRGFYTSNIALVLGSRAEPAPHDVARALIAGLRWPGSIEEVNGFLNFQVNDENLSAAVRCALAEGEGYGRGANLQARRVNVEFVSADPNGPLTLAAGRMAVVGEALCRLLEFQGAGVTRECYVNDAPASSKVRLLGESVAAFYLNAFGRAGEAPEGILDDSFVRSVANDIVASQGNRFLLVPDAERATIFAHRAVEAAVAGHQKTLHEFGIHFDVWARESVLQSEGRVGAAMARLKERGYVDEHHGGLWLRSTALGDHADHPLTRASGEPAYLASDIAYHAWKFERGFDLLVNVWTAQHRPYVARTKAALQAAGYDADKVEVKLCQSARLLRDGTPIRLGKGGGLFSLDEALREVDRDSLCFWLLSRDWDEVVEIDLETAARDDESNPAYAAQLTVSRLGTMRRELEANEARAAQDAEAAWNEAEQELRRLIALWPDEAATAAAERAPHRVARFVGEMAAAVRRLRALRPAELAAHAQPVAARVQLLHAAQITASNALRVLGIEANEKF